MKAAVLGFGTVGFGVYEMLKNAEGLEAGPVLVRQGKADAPFKVTELGDILQDPEIGAVAEVMGGIEPAYTYACRILNSGKHFVTSNKALVAEKGPELAALAEKNHAAFLFSAACGGGVPFLHNLSLAAQSDRIESVGGILNGTTNYILDAMQREDLSYGDALMEAQKLGFAEADPTADVSGTDAMRKIMLACAVAFGKLPAEGVCTEGIESFSADDAAYFREKGLVCRLIASGFPASAFVEPVLFPQNAPAASVRENFNMVWYCGKCSGKIAFTGQGAGRWPTASAVLRDLSDITCGRRQMMPPDVRRVSADNSRIAHPYCVRVPVGTEMAFPVKNRETFHGFDYIFTDNLSVSQMHREAERMRREGRKLFFAAVD